MFINLLIYSAVHDAIVLVVKATYCEIKIVIFVFSDLGIFFTIFFFFHTWIYYEHFKHNTYILNVNIESMGLTFVIMRGNTKNTEKHILSVSESISKSTF